MSAPMRLSAFQLRNLADALDALTRVRKHNHVDITPYMPANLGVLGSETNVAVSWDAEEDEYVIDDRNGS